MIDLIFDNWDFFFNAVLVLALFRGMCKMADLFIDTHYRVKRRLTKKHPIKMSGSMPNECGLLNQQIMEQNMLNQQMIDQHMMEQSNWAADEARKMVTPFEMGGYDMTQGNSFNMSETFEPFSGGFDMFGCGNDMF